MATQQNRIDGGNGRTMLPPSTEPQMTDLLRQLGTDGATLVRSEIALAKLEMREMARQLAQDTTKVVAAIALALTGALALLTAVIIGLGNLLGGRYGLSALIVGVVMLGIGAVLARGGMAGLKQPHRPEQTVETLKDTKDWASIEARQFKEEIRS